VLDGSPAAAIRAAAHAALAIPDAEVWHPQCALLVGYADSHDRKLSSSELDALATAFRTRTAELPLGTTYMGMLYAFAALRSGDRARATEIFDEMIAFARVRGERLIEPELVRLRGTLVEATDPAAAADAYRESIDLARSQSSRSFQLRAANSLAALWTDDPRRAEALALVAEALAPFTEATIDVVTARALLA